MADKELKEKPDGWAVMIPFLDKRVAEAVAREAAKKLGYHVGLIPRYGDFLNIKDYARVGQEDA